MPRQSVKGVLVALALAALGCGGGGSPTEPAERPQRGNWTGTITGTHAGLRVQGTCDFEMDLIPSLNSGRWWIDCPNGASSQGDAVGLTIENFAVLVLLPTSPRLTCPFDLTATRTEATLQGEFEVIDCNTEAVVSGGTFQLRRR